MTRVPRLPMRRVCPVDSVVVVVVCAQDPTPRYYVRDPIADVVLLSSSVVSCVATLIVVMSYFR